MKKNDMHIRNVQHVIAACCVLHNTCEIHGDSIDNDWMEETDSDLHSQTHITVPEKLPLTDQQKDEMLLSNG